MKTKKVFALFTGLIILISLCGCAADGKSGGQTAIVSGAEGAENIPEAIGKDSRRVYVQGTSFYVGGKEIWFNGANTPWQNWNDFGGSFEEDFWDEHFRLLEEAGVNATRIWINCNGLVGVIINEDGSFGYVTDKHWEDLDRLFELAEEHKIYIMATLMSFDHFKDSNEGHENWRNMIKSSENIDGFVEGYVIPFCERYGGNEYLFSIDLMNEPDWVHENKENGQQSWDDLSNLFAREAAAIHENSEILVTVGIGCVKYNSEKYEGNKVSDEYLKSLSGNENSYLDFYSPHYYDWQKRWFGYPFDGSPEDFKLEYDRPAVIGECAVIDEEDLADRYEHAYQNGWNGVFIWTSNGVDACGGYDGMKPATTHMLDMIKEKIYPE